MNAAQPGEAFTEDDLEDIIGSLYTDPRPMGGFDVEDMMAAVHHAPSMGDAPEEGGSRVVAEPDAFSPVVPGAFQWPKKAGVHSWGPNL